MATQVVVKRGDQAWIDQVKDEGGCYCDAPDPNAPEGNCNQWRGLYGDSTIEPCPHCGDKEFEV